MPKQPISLAVGPSGDLYVADLDAIRGHPATTPNTALLKRVTALGATAWVDAGWRDLFDEKELVKAGVMLDGAGLKPTSQGARIRFSGNKRTVIDGPFTETKELIAGYWIIQVKNMAEAIEWMKRCPNPHEEDCEIEIRPFFELEDFGESAAVEHHRSLGEQMAAQRK